MDPAIFEEKVRRPQARGLVRERLEKRMSPPAGVGLGSAAVCLVIGPPGSGKTTLLSHLAASSESVAWYRVGSEDDDERALTRHLAYALAGCWPSAGAGDSAALPDAEAATLLAARSVHELVRALEHPAIRPAQLIVDDLHELAGSGAEEALESFLLLRPRKIQVALGSRRPPRINTSRMIVSGELTQIDGEDLRFRSWEVEELFRAVYGAPLSPEASAALTRRTGGWAAGLQLFHLATAQLSRGDRERAVRELNGRSALVRTYLARNALDGLPPERRRFLITTATLGVLTGDLCDALLDTTGSALLLAELEREQFFTTTTDGGLTYRYHQVLQTNLELMLVDELGGPAARDLYSHSGELLEAAGRPSAAVRAYARAEDWGSVGRLVRADAAPAAGDEVLWGALSLPGAPNDDPGLVLAGARRLARQGQLTEAVAAFRQAEALVDDPEFRRRCTIERTAVGSWQPQAALPPLPPMLGNEPHSVLLRTSVQVRQLTRQLRGADTSAGPLVGGLALLLAGEWDEAEVYLAGSGPDPAPGGSPLTPAWSALAIRLASLVVDVLRRPGEAVASQVEEVMLGAEVEGWPWLARLARGIQAATLLASSPAPWRHAAETESLAELDRRGDRWTFCLTALAFGAAYLRTGEAERADSCLQQASDAARALGAPTLQVWADGLRSAVARERGASDADRAVAAAVRVAGTLGITRLSEILDRARPGAAQAPADEAAVPAEAFSVPVPMDQTQPAPATRCSIELRCLGSFSLSVDGQEVPLRALRPRARALLMLLAMNNGHQVHREQLVDVLWPDSTLASGIRSLQVAVSSIRQALLAAGSDDDVLRREGDAYVLDVPAASDQRAEFERMARSASREETEPALRTRLAALDLYAGDLLPEAGPADWVVDERSRLRTLAAAVAADAAAGALDAGDPAVALEAARRSVALDAYHDSGWELIQQAYAQLGDFSGAAVARREQQRVWADLGLDPRGAGRLPASAR